MESRNASDAPPVTFDHVLEGELRCINDSRQQRGVPFVAHPSNLIGLAFSGGGLRSATFNLGMLQGLAQKGLLHKFDYISTVSGGGYIGSWLAALTRRFSDTRRDTSFQNVERLLVSETSAIRWLRHYGTYLTPRTGPLSSDTWARRATRLRNVFLNHVVLILMLLGLSSILDVALLSLARAGERDNGFAFLIIGATILFISCVSMAINVVQKSAPLTFRRSFFQRNKATLTITLPFVLTCVLLSGGLWQRLDLGDDAPIRWSIVGATFYSVVWGIVAIMAVLSHTIRKYHAQPLEPTISITALLLFSPLAGALGGFLLWVYVLLLQNQPYWSNTEWVVAVFGSGTIMVILLVLFAVHLGLLGRGLGVQARDGIARIWGELLLASMIWMLSAGLAEFGPLLVRWLLYKHLAARLLLVWLVWSLLGVLAASSGRSGEKLGTPPLIARLSKFLEGLKGDFESIKEADVKQMLAFLIKLPLKLLTVFTSREVVGVVAASAPYAYALGALLLITTVVQISCGMTFALDDTRTLWSATNSLSWDALFDHYWRVQESWSVFFPLVLGTVFIIGAYALSRRLGVNDFSVNHFFQSRLVGYYLGAVNPDRNTQVSTGFVPSDDLPLNSFTANYCGPYPILNATLNVTADHAFGYATRLSRSFVFTPLYCGYDLAESDPLDSTVHHVRSFSRTALAGSQGSFGAFGTEGISLGRAMVISGAGTSRYTGYYPVVVTSAFMHLFDVRLGWWIGNPRYLKSWRNATPGWGLLSGLSARSDLDRDYVYLTDGGHFDNLGLYELIKRRCRLIVCCDAELDSEYAFEDLANAVEKVRADFGVRIQIDFDRTRPLKGERQSETNFAVGEVFFSPSDYSDRGTIIYVKIGVPKSSNALPHDVWHYFEWNRAFPHEATAREWFDEQQFESYRALGEYISRDASRQISGAIDGALSTAA